MTDMGMHGMKIFLEQYFTPVLQQYNHKTTALKSKYRKISNIRRTKSQNLNVCRLFRLAVIFAQTSEARCSVRTKM